MMAWSQKRFSKKIYLLIQYIDEFNSNLASKTQNDYYYLLLFLSGTAPRKNLVEIEISKGITIICIALAEWERESSQEDLSNRIAPNTTHLHNTWAVKRTYESTGNNIVPKWGRWWCHAWKVGPIYANVADSRRRRPQDDTI